MDRDLFFFFNRWAGYGDPVDYFAFTFAHYGLLFLALMMLVRWLWPGAQARRERHTVVLTGGATLFALGVSIFPALFVYRARPFLALEGAFNMLGVDPSNSFPSLHSSAGFAVAFVMGWESKRWALLAWPVALLMAWARVYGGGHYPSDLLGSFVIALLCAWFFSELRAELEPAMDRVVRALGGGKQPGRLNSEER